MHLADGPHDHIASHLPLARGETKKLTQLVTLPYKVDARWLPFRGTESHLVAPDERVDVYAYQVFYQEEG